MSPRGTAIAQHPGLQPRYEDAYIDRANPLEKPGEARIARAVGGCARSGRPNPRRHRAAVRTRALPGADGRWLRQHRLQRGGDHGLVAADRRLDRRDAPFDQHPAGGMAGGGAVRGVPGLDCARDLLVGKLGTQRRRGGPGGVLRGGLRPCRCRTGSRHAAPDDRLARGRDRGRRGSRAASEVSAELVSRQRDLRVHPQRAGEAELPARLLERSRGTAGPRDAAAGLGLGLGAKHDRARSRHGSAAGARACRLLHPLERRRVRRPRRPGNALRPAPAAAGSAAHPGDRVRSPARR